MAIINGFFMGFYWDDKNGMIVMIVMDSMGFKILFLSIDLGNLLIYRIKDSIMGLDDTQVFSGLLRRFPPWKPFTFFTTKTNSGVPRSRSHIQKTNRMDVYRDYVNNTIDMAI